MTRRKKRKMSGNIRRLQNDIIYGPIQSRRLGRSLGVNVLPTEKKVCSFDCVYCQYGWTCCQDGSDPATGQRLPTDEEISRALEKSLKSGIEVDVITLAGNGEPTLHPQFREISQVVKAVRDRLAPAVKTCILSNSSTVNFESVREGLFLIDRKIMKLDAGTEETFRKVNRPRGGLALDKIVEILAGFENVEIQALFFAGEVCNSSEEDIRCWLEALKKIGPVRVQVYSLDRTTAMPGLTALDKPQLDKIAELARGVLADSAQVEVY